MKKKKFPGILVDITSNYIKKHLKIREITKIRLMVISVENISICCIKDILLGRQSFFSLIDSINVIIYVAELAGQRSKHGCLTLFTS